LIYFIFRDDTYVISSVFTCLMIIGELTAGVRILLEKGPSRHHDEGMTPRSSIFAYPVPAKKEARSKDTRSPQGPALRLGVEGKKYL
jgi:hypothetical protein